MTDRYQNVDAGGTGTALLYCHDTFGLGHLRRTTSVAQALADGGVVGAQLIVTGSPVASSFPLPPDADLVKLPSAVKERIRSAGEAAGADGYLAKPLRMLICSLGWTGLPGRMHRRLGAVAKIAHPAAIESALGSC